MVKKIILFILVFFSFLYSQEILNVRTNYHYYYSDLYTKLIPKNSEIYPLKLKELDINIKMPIEDGFFYKVRDTNTFILTGISMGGDLRKDFSLKGNYGFYSLIIGLKTKKIEFWGDFKNNRLEYNRDVFKFWKWDSYTEPYYNIETNKTGEDSNNVKLYDRPIWSLNIDISKDFQVDLGHNSLSIGPSFFDNIFLSDSSLSYDYYIVSYNISRFKYSWGLLFLITDTLLLNKYFAFHRLEFPVFSFINIGFYEGVMFMDRFVPMYVFPVVPFVLAEHYYGDQDNKALGGDITLYKNGFKVYLGVFVDDMTTVNLYKYFTSDWWSDKWALSTGIGYLKKLNKDYYYLLALDYTRVEPWVYAHHVFDGYLRMTHYTHPISFSYGCDVDRLKGSLEFGILKRGYINFTGEYVRKGPRTIYEMWDPEIYPSTKTFLEYIIYKRKIFGTFISYNIYRSNWILANFYLNYNYDIEIRDSQIQVGLKGVL